MGHWILKDGKIRKVPLMVWAKWFETSPDRIVERTIVGKVLRDYQVRYCTLAQAKKGHKAAVKFAENILK